MPDQSQTIDEPPIAGQSQTIGLDDFGESDQIRKPMLSPEELVVHLKSRGVTFNLCNEQDAADFLRNSNNYLRTASYRKLYDRQTEGKCVGDYINLDFGYLVALSSLDRKLRETMLTIVIDIEHFAKMSILERAQKENEDGYAIISEYRCSLSHPERNRLDRSLSSRSRSGQGHDTFTGDLIEKYANDMPLWVFLEVIELGRLIDFYRFCATRWKDKRMDKFHYVLKSVKAMRNACAHNSCIINGFTKGATTIDFQPSSMIVDLVTKLGIKNTNSRRAKLRNLRISQIVAVICADVELCILPSTIKRHSALYEDLRDAVSAASTLAARADSSLSSYRSAEFRDATPLQQVMQPLGCRHL